MSLFTIAQTVLEEQGIRAPTVIVGNGSTVARQMLRLINRSGKDLSKEAWPGLEIEEEITTSATVENYPVPNGFESLISNTVWDRSNYWQVRGAMNAQEWQVRRSALVAQPTTRKGFRLGLNLSSNIKQIRLDPIPTATETLVYEYRSNFWVKAADGTQRSEMLSDTDVALGIPEGLIELDVIWRFRRAKGLDYDEEYSSFMRQRDIILGRANPAGVLSMGGARSPTLPNVPEGNFPG